MGTPAAPWTHERPSASTLKYQAVVLGSASPTTPPPPPVFHFVKLCFLLGSAEVRAQGCHLLLSLSCSLSPQWLCSRQFKHNDNQIVINQKELYITPETL